MEISAPASVRDANAGDSAQIAQRNFAAELWTESVPDTEPARPRCKKNRGGLGSREEGWKCFGNIEIESQPKLTQKEERKRKSLPFTPVGGFPKGFPPKGGSGNRSLGKEGTLGPERDM